MLFGSVQASRLILLRQWSLVLTKASSVFQGNKGQGGVKGEKVRLASTGAQSRRGRGAGSVFGLRTEQLRYLIGDPEGGNLRSHQRLLPVWPDVTGPRS